MAQLLGRDFLEVGEVETQTVGRDERALLFDVVSKDFAQGLIHEVCGGVVGFSATTAIDINAGHKFGRDVGGKLVREGMGRLFSRLVSKISTVSCSLTSTPVSPTWPPISA